jgi:hypothetical protein
MLLNDYSPNAESVVSVIYIFSQLVTKVTLQIPSQHGVPDI